MAKAGVSDWRDLDEPFDRLRAGSFPLLLLIVDEAADFRGDVAMDTLVEIARKGRAFGVSILLGTQSPSSKVIDPQVRANLPTAIAFQARTHIESKVILGCKGAEDLSRPGQALTFIGGTWQKVQVLRVDPDSVGKFISEQVVVERPADDSAVLSEIERALVRYAVEELDGAFTINRLYERYQGDISRRQLVKLGRQWERRGWLTEPRHAADPRRVTDELFALISPAPER
jgi:DNA segregation ATPase FtsK/SpoIIIE-like protein